MYKYVYYMIHLQSRLFEKLNKKLTIKFSY